MSDHKEFCDWLTRNRSALSAEAFEAGDRVARWLAVLESEHAMPDAPMKAADALKEFRELCGR
jgi:hypothetical protein